MRRCLGVIAVFAALAVFSCAGEDEVDENSGGDRCGGTCLTGQYCWNGICVDGCLNDDTCAGNQYCDIDDFTGLGHCQNTTPAGCEDDAQCMGEQTCKMGACVTPPVEQETGCEWKSNGTDGCTEYEVCIQEEDAAGELEPGDCYEMPACGQNGECPTQVSGAVCNEMPDGTKIISSKARICLMGLCMEDTDCPTEMSCMKFYSDLGACVPEMFAGCEDDSDCGDSEVCEPMSGQCIPDMGF